MVGLPKLLKEEDVEAEYPSDIDDDFVTEEGFLPTLPGDSTKISSAIALFRGSRVLTNVLNTVYPGSASHELSYAKLKDLEDELDAWKNGLAPHLRLEFVNGSPSTNLVGSRSPLLVSRSNSASRAATDVDRFWRITTLRCSFTFLSPPHLMRTTRRPLP